MPKSEASKGYEERHRRLGLCLLCNRIAKTGMLHCEICLARKRKWWRARHPLFCAECGKEFKPDERTGRSLHRTCAQKRLARKYPQWHRSAVLAYQRRHRELGLCFNCPRKAFKGGRCRKHYRMALKISQSHGLSLGGSSRRHQMGTVDKQGVGQFQP